MRGLQFTGFVAVAVWIGAGVAGAAEERCGWYMFPTPGNLLLADKEGEWSITSQGQANGPDATGVAELAPEFDTAEFVAVGDGGYGYGCACLSVSTDAGTMRITEVFGGKSEPLARCKGDAALPVPDM